VRLENKHILKSFESVQKVSVSKAFVSLALEAMIRIWFSAWSKLHNQNNNTLTTVLMSKIMHVKREMPWYFLQRLLFIRCRTSRSTFSALQFRICCFELSCESAQKAPHCSWQNSLFWTNVQVIIL